MTQKLRIGIAGLGTVGAAVFQLVERHNNRMTLRSGRSMQVVAVAARNKGRDRGIDLSSVEWFDDPVALAGSASIDVFVELMGGDEGAARQAVETALRHGKLVVTANKALLAKHGMALARLAQQNKTSLFFEAAVAGGIPVIKTLREAMAGNTISRISGILNGTCNYILSRMELEGLTYQACLSDAQRLGYAEADPTFDVGGFDTAHKLALLSSLAFGTEIDADAIYVEGIDAIDPLDLKMAEELGYRIKLLGVAERTPTGIEQRVHPTMVDRSTALAQVMGVTNAVTISGDAVGDLTLVGPGAGGMATASSVMSDLADAARGSRVETFALPVEALDSAQRAPMQRHEGGYYVRLSVLDRPGAVASIATRMAERNISLESIVQRKAADHGKSGSAVPVVLITHATSEEGIRAALDAVSSDGHIAEKPQLIRIERN